MTEKTTALFIFPTKSIFVLGLIKSKSNGPPDRTSDAERRHFFILVYIARDNMRNDHVAEKGRKNTDAEGRGKALDRPGAEPE